MVDRQKTKKNEKTKKSENYLCSPIWTYGTTQGPALGSPVLESTTAWGQRGPPTRATNGN